MKKLLSVLTLCMLTVSVNAAEKPGLVSEKPSEGRFVKTDQGFMVPYKVTIPGTEVAFWMEPIPGGEYVMGSPETESGREDVEGPQKKVKVAPFWMARLEVTWKEYNQFISLYDAFKAFEENGLRPVTEANQVDAITAPTPLYEPSFTYEYGGDPELPAVTITQYSAKQYSKWMSAITDMQFRLPTEAEWEYACRGGATTAFHFGDDASKLGDYGWFLDNTGDGGQRKGGQKKPNPWGLYDMHGNVAEWVLDNLEPYEVTDKVFDGATWVTKPDLDPRVVRGGSWEFEAYQCRCASRLGSDSSQDEWGWREYDPNTPASPWWFTSDPARGVGFRLIRTLKEVPRQQMEEAWKIDNEDTQYDVADRLSEGRGAQGLVDKSLPAAIKALNDK
ncbi:MAG: formylglycine-generating enzyme family protein [Fuerstiella sp.]